MEERAPRYYMSDRDADRSCLHKIKTTTEQSPLMMDKINFNLCVAYKESLSTLSNNLSKEVVSQKCVSAKVSFAQNDNTFQSYRCVKETWTNRLPTFNIRILDC